MTDYRDQVAAAHLRAGRLRDRAGAAAYLGVSVRTIDRLIESGELKTVRLPVERAKSSNLGRVGRFRRIHIDVADLDALIERSKERAAPVTSPIQRRLG